jgi:hypothetical protein
MIITANIQISLQCSPPPQWSRGPSMWDAINFNYLAKCHVNKGEILVYLPQMNLSLAGKSKTPRPQIVTPGGSRNNCPYQRSLLSRKSLNKVNQKVPDAISIQNKFSNAEPTFASIDYPHAVVCIEYYLRHSLSSGGNCVSPHLFMSGIASVSDALS